MPPLFSNIQLVITQQHITAGARLSLSFCPRAPPTQVQQPDGHSPAQSHLLPLSVPLALSIRRGAGSRTREHQNSWMGTKMAPNSHRHQPEAEGQQPPIPRPQAETSFFGHSRILLPSPQEFNNKKNFLKLIFISNWNYIYMLTWVNESHLWVRDPGGSDSTEPTCQCRRPGFDPWVGKIPWRRTWQPTPVFLPGESQGQRSLAGYGQSMGLQRVRHNWMTNTFTLSIKFDGIKF